LNPPPPAGTDNLVQQLQGADDVARDNACMLLAFAIAAIGHGPLQNNPSRSADFEGQNIASVLVDSNYRLLRWGINTNRQHSSLHGEINLIRSFQNRNQSALPLQGKLFTTLEPCAMCSGMVVHAAGAGNAFEVISGQVDAQVGFSALRNPNGVDGFTINARNVTSRTLKLPLLPLPLSSTFGNLPPTSANLPSTFGNYMNSQQLQNSPEPGPNQQFRLMQTTRYLEQHAGPVMSDAAKMLDKMAALWLPAAARPAWRASRDRFLLHVQASIRT
jgi:tRNA(Arg) A34 adenosine deaminase TadA